MVRADFLLEALEKRFKESVTALSHDDIRRRLQDDLSEKNQGTGNYAYICDVYGDDESGDVVYSCGGCCYRAPYSMVMVAGKPDCEIETDKAVKVLPRTIYDEDAEEADHMATMESSRMGLGIFERFISKDERAAAGSGSFAGKGKSFPILKPGDVMAAVRSLGRAGSDNYSTDVIKSNIKRIAKAKGFALPDSMKDDAKESELEMAGEFIPLREGAVGQDGTAFLKLIAPGWGSSGYYSKEVLKRDGAKVFPSGTKNFWNHQTAAEESARPEGDLRDLASVLTEDAHYDENGPAGAGLYAKASVMPHFREHVDSLAKHIGMSIRAMGTAKEGTAEGRKGPVIEKLTRGQSVDYVTSPGAGGKVLQLFEAARAAAIQLKESDDMDEVQVQRLIENAIGPLKAENKKLQERLALATDAPHVLREVLSSVNLPEAARQRISERCLASAPIKDGKLEETEFKKIIEREIKDEGDYISRLTQGRIVVGMGTTSVSTDPKVIEANEAAHSTAFNEAMEELAEVMVGSGDKHKDGRKIFREGRAA